MCSGCYQIANLKAALARKEGEPDHQTHSRSSSPEMNKRKSRVPSPSLPSLPSLSDLSSSRRQPMEDVGNIQVYSAFKFGFFFFLSFFSNTVHFTCSLYMTLKKVD